MYSIIIFSQAWVDLRWVCREERRGEKGDKDGGGEEEKIKWRRAGGGGGMWREEGGGVFMFCLSRKSDFLKSAYILKFEALMHLRQELEVSLWSQWCDVSSAISSSPPCFLVSSPPCFRCQWFLMDWGELNMISCDSETRWPCSHVSLIILSGESIPLILINIRIALRLCVELYVGSCEEGECHRVASTVSAQNA